LRTEDFGKALRVAAAECDAIHLSGMLGHVGSSK
jgi:hypothetical protein